VSFSSPAIVEVETHDGRTLRKFVREMKGHPKNPLSASDIAEKFVECGERILPKSAVRRALAKIQKLEQLSSIDDLIVDLQTSA
jgi:2-methylcitrate dehydratase PrpD